MGLFSSEIATRQLVPLCRQLATSYDAGIPLVQTLEIVGRQSKNRQLRTTLDRMKAQIQSGSTLEEAARAQSPYLPVFFIQMLGTGERGGRLDIMLRDVADYFEDRLEMRRRFIGSMIYPAIQLTMAWVLGTFALTLVSNLSLSATQVDFGAIIERYLRLQAYAGTVLVIAFAAAVVLSRLGVLRWITGWVGTFVWPFAPVIRRFAMARFFRSMSLLIGSGMNVVRCIEGAAAVTANPYIERDLLKAIGPVQNGSSLTQAFAGSRFMTPMAREMMLVGEQSGQLEAQLRKASEWMVQEAVHAVGILQKFFGVFVILLVGAIVGYIVISFYASYFSILDTI